MNIIKSLSPSNMLSNPGRKIIKLAHVLYVLSLILGVVSGAVFIFVIYEMEGSEAFIFMPFLLIGGALLGLLMGVMTSLPMKGFGVIVEHCQQGDSAHSMPMEETPAVPASMQLWRCSCGAENPMSVGVCASCGERKAMSKTMSKPAAPASVQLWRCSCGAENPMSVGVCASCGERKAMSKTMSKTMSKPAVPASSTANSWRCSCYVVNPANRKICKNCYWWLCSCGTINAPSLSTCENCGESKPR